MGTLKTTNIQSISGSGTVTLGTSGETFAIPSGVTIANSGTATGFGEINTPAFFAYQTSAQSIANTTNTKLTIETEVFDTDSAYDNSSNYRFTPQTAGKYWIFAQVMFASSTNFNQIEIVIKKNTTVYSSAIAINDEYNTAYTGTIIDLNGSSDYVETFGYQNSGGSLNTYPSATSKYIRFGGYRVTT
tara:strand:+ start:510 stop:1073 length:564 start_codon:yes stop_codon:yes gene_type:complete